MTSRTAVAVVGAGPYGLAATAHLRSAGVDTLIFGDPMAFWREQMPAGMCLRSSWDASSISDPRHAYRLDDYQRAAGRSIPTPIPLDRFIAYGQWFQQQVAPDVDRRQVTWIEPNDAGFTLHLEDGRLVSADRVAIAVGIARFADRPPAFDGVPEPLASHAADHADLSRFAGRRVAVLGGGQSAIESAVLLRERGAEVEVIMRGPGIRWLRRSRVLHRLGAARRALYAPTDVGPAGLSWLVALPDLYRLLPRQTQDRLAYRSIRPAAAGWLYPRFRDVTLTVGRQVRYAEPRAGQLHLELDDGSTRLVDHALLATGYRVEVGRLPFLASPIVETLRQMNGYPVLAAGLESSVPGLHFLGAPAAWSFGPLMRFVSGTSFAARTLARTVGVAARRPVGALP